MRLTIILHGGPFDGTMMSVGREEGEWPTEIRVASGDGLEGPIEAHHYRRHDVDETGIIFMGSYKYTHSHECSRTLVDRWL